MTAVASRTFHEIDVHLGPGSQTLRISLVPPKGREPGTLSLQLGHGGQGLPDPFVPVRGAGAELQVPAGYASGIRLALGALSVLLAEAGQ